MLPERSMAQRMQDDEDHRLAMCGLSFDAAVEQELEDFEVRAHDFQFFASGRRDPAPPDAKRGQGVGGGPVRTGATRTLAPPSSPNPRPTNPDKRGHRLARLSTPAWGATPTFH